MKDNGSASRLPWIFASIQLAQNLRMLHSITMTDEGQHSLRLDHMAYYSEPSGRVGHQ